MLCQHSPTNSSDGQQVQRYCKKILQSFERTKTYRISMLVKGHFESTTLYWFQKEELHFQRSVLRMSLWQLCWEIDALLSLCIQFDFDFVMSLYHYNFFARVLKICGRANGAKLVVKSTMKYYVTFIERFVQFLPQVSWTHVLISTTAGMLD